LRGDEREGERSIIGKEGSLTMFGFLGTGAGMNYFAWGVGEKKGEKKKGEREKWKRTSFFHPP